MHLQVEPDAGELVFSSLLFLKQRSSMQIDHKIFKASRPVSINYSLRGPNSSSNGVFVVQQCCLERQGRWPCPAHRTSVPSAHACLATLTYSCP